MNFLKNNKEVFPSNSTFEIIKKKVFSFEFSDYKRNFYKK